MESIILQELKLFQDLKKTYKFIQKDIKDVAGVLYCDDEPLYDVDNNLIPVCQNWINIGYKLKNPMSKILSNLFPYKFEFKGQCLESIEAFFQGIKFKEADIQRLVFNYSGLDAVNIQFASSYNWQTTGCIYWQGKEIKRDSVEYDDLVDELYISAIQNPLYRQALKNVDKYILHSIGKINKEETVFTRYEFELELNCLSAFLKSL